MKSQVVVYNIFRPFSSAVNSFVKCEFCNIDNKSTEYFEDSTRRVCLAAKLVLVYKL